MDPGITLEEAAAVLGLHPHVMRCMARDGMIRIDKAGSIPALEFEGFALSFQQAREKTAVGAPFFLDWPTKFMRVGGIYYVQSGRYVKIGVTGNIAKRVSSLRVATPRPLALIAWEGGEHEQERLLHAEFKRHRVNGEWFSLNGPIWDRITRLNEAYLGLEYLRAGGAR